MMRGPGLVLDFAALSVAVCPINFREGDSGCIVAHAPNMNVVERAKNFV